MQEVTDSNFQDEVLKSNKLVVVDMWAPWCVDPNSTKILTANNELKSARNIVNNEKLITFNGKTLVSDIVKKSYTSNKLGHCREIVTETQRKIKTTDEHEFLTQSGWKQAIELKKGEKIAIMPIYEEENCESLKEKLILDNKDIIKIVDKGMRVNFYLEELKNLGL